MTQHLQWFRMYHRIVDDEKVRLLAFEDRWHFVAVCALKCSGLLDEPETDVKWRKVSLKMGVQARELDEIRRRLFEVGLVDELMHPTAWEDLQFRSDTSTERVRNFREKTKAKKAKQGRNVSVTRQETEADTESEEIANAISKNENGFDPTERTERVSKLIDPELFAACVALTTPVKGFIESKSFPVSVIAQAQASLRAVH